MSVALLIFSGCSTPLKHGVIRTPSVTIEAQDGTFRYETGERFEPFGYGQTYAFGQCIYDNQGNLGSFGGDVAGNLDYGLEIGAKRVRVTHAERGVELYGALLFCKRHDMAEKPISGGYTLVVPDRYIDAAQSGQVTAVYEFFEARTTKHIGWVLWLSDAPI